jgi:hypothetical protein
MARLTVYGLSALGIAALCGVVVAAWEWRCSPPVSVPNARTENGSTSGSPVSSAQTPDASRNPDSAKEEPSEPPYQKYLVWYGRVKPEGFTKPANDGFRVGYSKLIVPGEESTPADDIFYAWKGVTVHGAQIPGSSWFSPEEVVDLGRVKVVEVDPPVFYMPISGGLYTGRCFPAAASATCPLIR